MTDTTPAIQELKTRAEILHHRIEARDPVAIARLRVLPQFRRLSKSPGPLEDQLANAAASIRRSDCLTVIALELGFSNWPQASRVISGATADGDPQPMDFGTLLCPRTSGAHLNRWYRTHEEAVNDQARSESRGYLLGYRHQFMVVDRYYVAEVLRLDPDDPAWEAIGFDWVRPKDSAARTRLYAKLVAQLPRVLA